MNKTLEEGREVVYDLYDDVKEEVVEPLAPQVTDMMATATRVMSQVNQISDTVDKISEYRVLSFMGEGGTKQTGCPKNANDVVSGSVRSS